MVTFPTYQFSNILSKKIEIFFRGYPPIGPLKIKAFRKGPLITTYNPYFWIKNPFLQ